MELVTVLAILAVALALAYPSLAHMGRAQNLEAAAVCVARSLRLAHWRAVVTGDRTRVSADLEPHGGWRLRIQREQGAAWVSDGEEQALPAGVIVSIAGSAQKVFNPDGTCSLGSITVRGDGAAFYRCTLAPATGRVRFYRGGREFGRGL